MTTTLNAVRIVLIEALELNQRPEDLREETALFGSLPELDSFGVVSLVASLEDRFDITVDDDEFGAEIFETVGTLTGFVDGIEAAGHIVWPSLVKTTGLLVATDTDSLSTKGRTARRFGVPITDEAGLRALLTRA